MLLAAALLLTADVSRGLPVVPTNDDQLFITETARFNLLEMQLGETAILHSRNPNVQAFARQAIALHTRLNQELEGVARNVNAVLPRNLDEPGAKMIERLKQVRDPIAFNRAYVHASVTTYQAAAAHLRNAASATPTGMLSPPIVDWSGNHLTTIESQYAAGADLAAAIRAGWTGTSEP
jgi:predicted outer membrane protein